MPSELRLIKRCAEYRQRADWNEVPQWLRGIYVLVKHRRGRNNKRKGGKFDVIYVGMSKSGGKGGIRDRLKKHDNRLPPTVWTHFSIFEIWDNIRTEEIAELEGLFRHIYSQDTRANSVNKQRKFGKLVRIRENNLTKWASDKRDF
jgi:hypothetical protein